MTEFDCAIIGGGLLGCFCARELMRYKLSAVIIEKESDVCTGLTKANTAIVYPGYDNHPGSLKASMTVRANAGFNKLCRELDVPFSRCGSLMTAGDEASEAVLRKKLENGKKNNVPGLRLLTGDEARELEPGLTQSVTAALYSPSAGTIDPWALCYGAYENALHNGCKAMPNSAVKSVSRARRGYVIETSTDTVTASTVINCAGLYADRVHELLFPPDVRIFPDCSDMLIMDPCEAHLSHIILQETASGKGITAVPTVDGRVLVESRERRLLPEASASSCSGLENGMNGMSSLLPGYLDLRVIRSFAAPRPNPHRVVLKDGEYVPDGKSLGDFVILRPESGFVSLVGVKTPGLTCAHELGRMISDEIAAVLSAEKNTAFDPIRRAIPKVRDMSFKERRLLCENDPSYLRTICVCEDITEGEIVEAIRRGATSTDGVKRRCGASLGECQGSRCRYEIARLLSKELGATPMSYMGEEGQR